MKLLSFLPPLLLISSACQGVEGNFEAGEEGKSLTARARILCAVSEMITEKKENGQNPSDEEKALFRRSIDFFNEKLVQNRPLVAPSILENLKCIGGGSLEQDKMALALARLFLKKAE